MLDHYLALDQPEAADRLLAAVRAALTRVAADPLDGKPFPAGYKDATRWSYRWVEVHRYWFAHSSQQDQLIVTNILFEAANIPGRIATADDGLTDLP